MFASKAGAYASEAPFRCSLLGLALGFTHKHKTTLNRDKHSSLFGSFVSWGNFFSNIGTSQKHCWATFWAIFRCLSAIFSQKHLVTLAPADRKVKFSENFGQKKIQTIFSVNLAFKSKKFIHKISSHHS